MIMSALLTTVRAQSLEIYDFTAFNGAYPPGTRLSIETYQNNELVGVSEGFVKKTLPRQLGTPAHPVFLTQGWTWTTYDKARKIWVRHYNRLAVGLYVQVVKGSLITEGWLCGDGEVVR